MCGRGASELGENRHENDAGAPGDCESFQVTESEQIQAALTHDQHFARAGFEMLPR